MKKENLPVLAYFALLSLIITLPLFSPGYILTLDMITVPKTSWPSIWQPDFFISLINQLFNLILPSYWFHKIILFLIFFLSGISMAGLAGVKNIFIKLFAGTLYSVNPFVYERVMAGHWYFLLAYALFPWVIMATTGLFSKPGFVSAIKLALLATLIFNLFVHFTVIFAVFFVVYGILFLIFNSRNLNSKLFYNLGLSLLFVLILNLNWLIPVLIGKSFITNSLRSFSRQDLLAFQSVADPQYGLIFNLLSGFGFWEEVYDYFISLKLVIPFWPVLSLLILAIFILGLLHLLTKERNREILPLKITLVIIFILALDFAGGIALKPFRNTVVSLYDKFPVLYGFREPQKLISLVILGYAFFGAYGLEWLISLSKNKVFRLGLPLFFVVLPFVYTPLVFGSFRGQLKPVFYPDSWQKVNQLLTGDKDDFLVLFFPWHQYLRFNFSNNLVIANPAPYFFEKKVLSARNYETAPLYSHDDRPEALHIEGLLSIREKGYNLMGQPVDYQVDWGADLSPIGIKYIILAKDSDWKKYLFLESSDAISKIYEDGQIILYKNLSFGLADIRQDSSGQNLDGFPELSSPSATVIRID